MGRIKTKRIKSASEELVEKRRSELKDNFEENKVLVEKFMDIESKKFKNVLAGYVTRLMKRDESI